MAAAALGPGKAGRRKAVGMIAVTETDGRYHCARCTMSYVIGEAPSRAALSRCRECHLLFWHLEKLQGVVVGITPHELIQHSPEGAA